VHDRLPRPGEVEAVEVLSASDCEGEWSAWDAFVRDAADSSFCHLSGWRDVFGGVLGHECIYRVALDHAGSWTGLLPLVRVRSAIFGHYLLSMPFLNYGGALGSESARSRLTADAVRLAETSRTDLLELRNRVVPPSPPLKEARRKVTVVRELPEEASALWSSGLKAKVRSQIRRPQKEGMVARFGTSEREPFYEVFARNMRDLGTPVLPARFFEAISASFPNEVEYGCVYLKDTPVAAGCGFVWRDEFEMTWASSLKEHSTMAPNMLLYWSFMERMVERGMRRFNFGRCTPDSGTHRFKLQWGGLDEMLPWGQWSSRELSETPNPNRPAYQMAARLWSRLPLAIANRLGPLIARQLP
jgi:FemAB-related protein (PEP-CTERM system-associated)